jgi:hypothetical protein
MLSLPTARGSFTMRRRRLSTVIADQIEGRLLQEFLSDKPDMIPHISYKRWMEDEDAEAILDTTALLHWYRWALQKGHAQDRDYVRRCMRNHLRGYFYEPDNQNVLRKKRIAGKRALTGAYYDIAYNFSDEPDYDKEVTQDLPLWNPEIPTIQV